MRSLVLLSAALLASSPAFAEETVRIAIVEKAREITLSGRGLEVRELFVGEKYAPAPGGRSVVRYHDGEMLLDGAPVKAPDGLKFRSEDFVRVAGQPVRGQIEVRFQGEALAAINVIPVEDYLAAVLGSEMPRSFPEEALKAQAVAARTYAVRRKIESWGKPYHMGSTVLSQVYGGARTEDERTRKAVAATRGEVLTWKMEPIEAYFHSSCGGHTEQGGEALGRNLPYLRSVACVCSDLPASRWSLKLSSGDLDRILKDARTLEVLDRSPSGRARRVQVANGRAERMLSAVELRRRLGYERMRSLDFEVEREKGGLLVRGRGFGHGAGMCQWGAKLRAEQGWDYKRIVAHYYPGAVLKRMY